MDFTSHPCRPGTLLWVRPGQAHRFHHPGSLDGKVVLFTADFPPDLLLAVLLLRIDRLPIEDDRRVDSATAELFGRFQAELERSYAITRSAEHYAARLGYTVKHLTRACVAAAAGHPAKHLIDARVVLEAKRLLAFRPAAAHRHEPASSPLTPGRRRR
ncbi:AraC family ligand binding domain-containing protein [Nonomuraea sp. NPDC050680]|uniref:AraC family ligand binding domain-containing protein n=1 Tax=Nonomuraea sp. NPDC050680 TaxID=3154630 RepID=UPI0033E4E925